MRLASTARELVSDVLSVAVDGKLPKFNTAGRVQAYGQKKMHKHERRVLK